MPVNRFSQIFTPSEYTSPIDLSSYASLINRRQQLFDVNQSAAENKLQSIIDLPVSREVDRQYINEKVGKTTEALNNIGNKDYSDPMVMREINNHISAISYDPVVNAALSSTQMMNADNKEVEFFKKKGAGYSEANAFIIQKAQADYLNNPDINAKYNKVGYTPHTPWDKEIQEKLKNLKGLEYITSTVIDPNDPSKQYQERIKISEITPDRVIEVLSQTMTPEQRNQIRIDAEYQWRGAGDAHFVQWQTEHQGLEIQQIDKSLLDVKNARTASLRANVADTRPFDEQIAKLEKERDLLKNQLNNPDALLLKARENSNELKTWQFYRQYSQGLGNLFQTHDITVNSGVVNLGESNNKTGTPGGTLEAYTSTLNYVTTEDKDGLNTGNHTKSYFTNDLANIKNEQIASRSNTWGNLVRTGDPQYKNKTPAEQEVLFANWEKQFYEGKTVPKDVENHLVAMAKLNSRAEVTKKILDAGNAELQKDPEYQKSVQAVEAYGKLLPKESEFTYSYFDDGPESKKEIKKVRSKESILNLQEALIRQNLINKPFIISTDLLPLTNGDNSLIEEFNNIIKNTNDKRKNIPKWVQTTADASEFLLYAGERVSHGIKNPFIYSGSQSHEVGVPETQNEVFSKYGHLVKTASEYINRIETDVYKKMGYANLVPTVVLTGKNELQEQVKPMISQLRLSFNKKESESSIVTNVNAMTGQPDGQVLISYDIKDGDKTQTSTMVVPRRSMGNLNQFLPEDPDEGWFEKIRAAGGTSEDIKYAPVVATPEGPLHYRIYPKNGGMQLQFFNPETRTLDFTDSPIPVFTSLYDMNLFLSNLATNYANAKKTQTSK